MSREYVDIDNYDEDLSPDDVEGYEESTTIDEVMKETPSFKEDITIEEMNNFANYMAMESGKKRLLDDMHKYDKIGNDLKQSFSSDVDIDVILDEKLSKYNTVEELTKVLKDDKDVKEFYTDDNGNEIGILIDFKTEKDKIDFMRESLILFKTIDVAHANIDIEFDKLDNATKELSAGLKDACYQLSDNVLTYTGYLKDKAALCEDNDLKKKIFNNAKYIESAYNLEVYTEILDKHKSVATNTRDEIKDYLEGRTSSVEKTGTKYIKNLTNNKVSATLTAYTSSDIDQIKSFEERFLLEEDYEVKDLFIYSIIRFFARADWSNNDIKMAHSSICLMLTKMYNNSLDKELQKEVLNNIKEYIKRFN